MSRPCRQQLTEKIDAKVGTFDFDVDLVGQVILNLIPDWIEPEDCRIQERNVDIAIVSYQQGS